MHRLKYILLLLSILLNFQTWALEEYYYEPIDTKDPIVFNLHAIVENDEINYSFSHIKCLDLMGNNESLDLQNTEVDIFSAKDQFSTFGGVVTQMYLDASSNINCSIEVSIMDEKAEKLEIILTLESDKKIVRIHEMQRQTNIKNSKSSSNSKNKTFERLAGQISISEEMSDKTCQALFAKNCDEVREYTASKSNGPYHFLEPEWRLPQIQQQPKENLEPNAHQIENTEPYIQLKKPEDFKKIVKNANINCLDPKDCPETIALLLGLKEFNQSYQCSTNYIKNKKGWFSTNAHCIPADLSQAGAGSRRDCSGRIFVKFPKTATHSSLTLECDEIRYVSDYKGNSKGPDMAYFTVKNSELLADRTPLEIDFSRPHNRVDERVRLSVVNPVPDKEGLNGVVQTKHCTFTDPLKHSFFFPDKFAMGSVKLFMQDCDVDLIQGNSGTAIQSIDSNKIIGWLDSRAAYNRTSKNSQVAPEANIKTKYFSGTTASCFTEPITQNGELIAGFINTSSCDWISSNQLEQAISYYEGDQLNKALVSNESLLDQTQNELENTKTSLSNKDAELNVSQTTIEGLEKLVLDTLEEFNNYMEDIEISDRVKNETGKIQLGLNRRLRPQITQMSHGILGVQGQMKHHTLTSDLIKFDYTMCVNPPEIWAHQWKESRFGDGIYGPGYPVKNFTTTIEVPYNTEFVVSKDSNIIELNDSIIEYKHIVNDPQKVIDLGSRPIDIKISPIGNHGTADQIKDSVHISIKTDSGNWYQIKSCD